MKLFTKSQLQYQRQAPTKDAQLYVIFCEGSRTEPSYFRYFEELSSRIKLEVVPADSQADNSPTGLLALAKLKVHGIQAAGEKVPSKYDLVAGDEVWFVVDTDNWGPHLTTLRDGCQAEQNWFVAQSNPCFEVWLYYHFHEAMPDFEGFAESKGWKGHLGALIPGGFNPLKHPVLIQAACENARRHCHHPPVPPPPGTTQMYLLAERIIPALAPALDAALTKMRADSH